MAKGRKDAPPAKADPYGALSHKQRVFVDRYLVHLNASRAAREAGYSDGTVRNSKDAGVRLMNQPMVSLAIADRMHQRSERVEIEQDDVVRELARMAFANLADYIAIDERGAVTVDLGDMTREQAAALSEITVDEYMEGRGEAAREVKRVKVKMADKSRALELIGRHLAMFTDNINLAGRLATVSDDELDRQIEAATAEVASLEAPGGKVQAAPASEAVDVLPGGGAATP